MRVGSATGSVVDVGLRATRVAIEIPFPQRDLHIKSAPATIFERDAGSIGPKA